MPPSQDTEAPQVQITSPGVNASVPANTTVVVQATDNVGVIRIDLLVDDQLAASRTAQPWSFAVVLKAGTHLLKAVAYDAAGNKDDALVTVTVAGDTPTDPPPTDPPPTDPPPTDPPPTDPPPTDPPAQGAFGDTCTSPLECQSGLCVRDPQLGSSYCTERCDQTTCPQNGVCLDAGAAGRLCGLSNPSLPGGNNGGGGTDPAGVAGCAVSSSAPAAPSSVLLLLLLLALVRRRRS